MTEEVKKLQRVFRKEDLHEYCGLQRTQINELIRSGRFPAPVPVYPGGRAVIWLEDELVKWQQEMIASRPQRADCDD